MSGAWEPCTTQLDNGTQCSLNRDHAGDCCDLIGEVREMLLRREPDPRDAEIADLRTQLAEHNDVVGRIRRVIDKGDLYRNRHEQILAIVALLDTTKAGLG